MSSNEIDLLTIDRGLVVSPAGCGKTQLITDALSRHNGSKPILVLTHTNAGVSALRSRLNRASVSPLTYRLTTIDGWAIRLISMFPERAAHDLRIVENQKPNYTKIREAAFNLLKASHISDVITASYSRLLVDEYQDCSIRQHAIVYYASAVLPTCVVGDPVQAIFGFGDDQLADWDKHVCAHFTLVGELNIPWRWINTKSDELGQWLLEARQKILAGQTIDLNAVPDAITWIQINGSTSDHVKHLEAARVKPPDGIGSVLIIGESTSPASQQKIASQTPSAVTVEAVDLRDLVSFARTLDINADSALKRIAEFAQNMMTNVGAADLVRRVDTIISGAARKKPNKVEEAAIAFQHDRTHQRIADFLVEINKDAGVRAYRPAVLRACYRALQMCSGTEDMTLHEAAVRTREQNRIQGHRLPSVTS